MRALFAQNRFHPLVIAVTTALASIAHAEDTANVQTLPVITVKAEEDTSVTEGTGSYTAKSTNTSTKLNLSPSETPQTVIVYTRQYLDDRNIQSYQDLMNNIPGVSTSRTDERLNANARGFSIDYYMIDGIPSTLTLSEGDPDLSLYDRVEIVKGANGLMAGAGNPSIGLNFIRKHANAKQLTGKVTASTGSWNNFSSTADISTPLNTDGSLRGRIFVKNSHEDSFMDFYEKERRIAYGAIDYDISESTKLSLSASYQELERNGVRWGGMPAFYTDGSRTNFDRSLTVSSDWTYWNVDSTSFTAGLQQKLFNDTSLNLNYSFRRDDVAANIYYTSGTVDKATNTGDLANVSAYASDKTTDENNVDIYFSTPFQLFGRDQEVIFGGSWNKNEVKRSVNGGTYVQNNPDLTRQNNIELLGITVMDYNNMNTQLLHSIAMNNKEDLAQIEQSAGYISGKFHILDPLKLIAGVRITNWKTKTIDGNGDGTVAEPRKFTNEITPYLGMVYDLSTNYSLYASYTSIFKPQNRKDLNDEYLDPTVGKSYETGIKGDFFDHRLNASLSVFRIEQDKVAVASLDASGGKIWILGQESKGQAYHNEEGVTSKGVELNVQGEINENIGVNFGIANFEAKNAKGVKISTTQARTTANLFVNYKYDKLSAGAGLNYYSAIYNGTGPTRIDRDDLYLANLMIGYQVNENIGLQLNVNNLFDKKYYEGIGNNSMNWGAPRNAVLSASYKF